MECPMMAMCGYLTGDLSMLQDVVACRTDAHMSNALQLLLSALEPIMAFSASSQPVRSSIATSSMMVSCTDP